MGRRRRQNSRQQYPLILSSMMIFDILRWPEVKSFLEARAYIDVYPSGDKYKKSRINISHSN